MHLPYTYDLLPHLSGKDVEMYPLPTIEASIASCKKMIADTYDPAHPEYSAEWRDMLTQLENVKKEQEALNATIIPHGCIYPSVNIPDT